jgi:hypothetical protein
MKLVTRPGIVHVSICGVRLLIPTRAASEQCPHMLRLNLLTTMIWNGLDKGKSPEEIKNAIRILTKRPEQDVDNLWVRTVNSLLEKGFLIRVEDDEI